MNLDTLLFWRSKKPSDNEWRPRPGQSPVTSVAKLPSWLRRMDVEAACVDTAPFVAGAGGLAHIRQLNNLGWTVPASIFRNVRTMTAMNRTAILLPPIILLCQATRIEYRDYIPRWCHDRERRRDEAEVRQHVETGEYIGLALWTVRYLVFRAGRAYWTPILEMVMGGALADLMHREYYKAHGF